MARVPGTGSGPLAARRTSPTMIRSGFMRQAGTDQAAHVDLDRGALATRFGVVADDLRGVFEDQAADGGISTRPISSIGALVSVVFPDPGTAGDDDVLAVGHALLSRSHCSRVITPWRT